MLFEALYESQGAIYLSVVQGGRWLQGLRVMFRRFTREAILAEMPVIEMLIRIANGKRCASVPIALPWPMAQRPFIVPILGSQQTE